MMRAAASALHPAEAHQPEPTDATETTQAEDGPEGTLHGIFCIEDFR